MVMKHRSLLTPTDNRRKQGNSCQVILKLFLDLGYFSRSPLSAWSMSHWKNPCDHFPNMKTYPFVEDSGEGRQPLEVILQKTIQKF